MTTENVSPTSHDYVTNAAWQQNGIRAGSIDDIADQFERPQPAGAGRYWDSGDARWPATPQPWDAGQLPTR